MVTFQFTSPSTSGESSTTIDSPVPAAGPPLNLISNTSTVTPTSRKKSSKLYNFIPVCIYVMFYVGHTNVHSSPAESDAISKYLVQYVPPPPVKKIPHLPE